MHGYQINLNDITVTSTATSTRGKTIEKDWTQHTAQHTESHDWWTSGKPRQLQRSSTDIVTTSTQIDSPTAPSAPILPAPVTTEETQQIPPAPELALPGDSTSPADPALSPRTSPPAPKSRNTTATTSDNRSANPTPAYRKKPCPSAPARRSASGHRTRRDNPRQSSSQNTRTSGSRYYKTPVYQQSQPQRGRNNNRPDKTNSDPCPHPVPLLSLPIPCKTTTRQYCHYCKRTGHSDNNCYRRNWCDHCCREGHTIDSCRSLLARERHEKLCHQLTEQTAATSRLVDFFIKHIAQPSRPGGLQTNIGDLIHSYVIPYTPDVIATVETFLNPTIPTNFGHIQGYSGWHRRDRANGTFGGIAVCFREGLAVEALDVDMDRHLELMFFRLWTRQRDTILLCICYHPQWQGSDPIHFLHTNLDTLLLQHSCKHLVVIGDMNQHLVARDSEELLTMYGLSNHVTFPTHTSGSSLDPVITDLPDGIITCHPLGMVGSSDHSAILTTINTTADNDEATARVNWLWSRGDWDGLRNELDSTEWTELLQGCGTKASPPS
ncbi:hypothetical protein Pcinc_026836 [Petrolisthes cinctipes]|uniref:Endonuclease/exonuclease/phosphatase domain-containing protein n=1 Tax=Petrolisthes cinctipes TaxID=88211 RepID=A0AAE1K9Q1_PETCI|nr:hypothetical protein Pcinc_026836 [Petrolisthes cinctipes]